MAGCRSQGSQAGNAAIRRFHFAKCGAGLACRRRVDLRVCRIARPGAWRRAQMPASSFRSTARASTKRWNMRAFLTRGFGARCEHDQTHRPAAFGSRHDRGRGRKRIAKSIILWRQGARQLGRRLVRAEQQKPPQPRAKWVFLGGFPSGRHVIRRLNRRAQSHQRSKRSRGVLVGLYIFEQARPGSVAGTCLPPAASGPT